MKIGLISDMRRSLSFSVSLALFLVITIDDPKIGEINSVYSASERQDLIDFWCALQAKVFQNLHNYNNVIGHSCRSIVVNIPRKKWRKKR